MNTDRISLLNNKPVLSNSYVLYWMQQSQRIESNHALNYAIEEANRLKVPLLLCFILSPAYLEASQRHYSFMLEGLQEMIHLAKEKNMTFHIYSGDPIKVIPHLANEAACIIADRGYLHIQRDWRRKIADAVSCSMVEVESDAIIPIEIASCKEEYAARTLRPKIHHLLDKYIVEESLPEIRYTSHQILIPKRIEVDLSNLDYVLKDLPIANSPSKVNSFRGGASVAKSKLKEFIAHRLDAYHIDRNKPSLEATSGLSPYLHFGQISPVFVTQQILKSAASEDVKATFLDELIIRRELSFNFCWYNKNYDTFDSLPDWAHKTLIEHSGDIRAYTYSYKQLENAATHDPYWNAAQIEMMETGYMHNYMRMYWGKKILEWIPDPYNAYEFALYLNNKYQLDGRDPNSYAGVAWCFGKHDRPWFTKPIFGTVRTMTSSGLERKFDMAPYVMKYHS